MSRLGSDERELRDGLLAALRRLDERGLNRGSTGNLSLRHGNGMLITPTGMGADDLSADDLVWLGFDGSLKGRWKPSSEWHFHQALYLARPDLNAVAHTHATHATALGPSLMANWLPLLRDEALAYARHVSTWELDRYAARY